MLWAAIEFKGPKNSTHVSDLIGECRGDFEKHAARLSKGNCGECYSIWVLYGPSGDSIEATFGLALRAACSVARGCSAEMAASRLMLLNSYPGSGDLVQRVYAIRVFSGFNLPAP